MRKTVFVLLLCICLFFSSACALVHKTGNDASINEKLSFGDTSKESDLAETPEATVELFEKEMDDITADEQVLDEPQIIESGTVTVDEKVLLDKDGITITLKSMGVDSIWGPSLKVLIENDTNNSFTVQIRNASINNIMVEGMFSCDVAAGKKANSEITFLTSELEIAGIETIKDIEFMFTVFDSKSWETILDSDVVTITTSVDSSFVQTFDDSGFVALNQDGFKIVVKRLESEESFWGADIYLYVENNSESDATIQIRDMSVNGFMIEPIFSCDVMAGKKAYDLITFLESDLTDNGINSIEELEFYFTLFEMHGWDSIFDSDMITVTFDK